MIRARPARRCRRRPPFAAALVALALLLRALVPAAQALPAPAAEASPWGPALVVCTAHGGDRRVTPEGEPLRARPAPAFDCLVCQGLSLGQVVLPALAPAARAPGAAGPTLLAASERRPGDRHAACVRARAPPLPVSPS